MKKINIFNTLGHFLNVLLLLLLLVGVNTNAWGLDEYVTVTESYSSSYNGSGLDHVSGGKFSVTANKVKFEINGLDKYQDKRLMYASIGSYPGSKSSTLSWSVTDDMYSVIVTGVSVSVRGYQPATNTAKATATLSGGGKSSTTAECQTNDISGANGAKPASITNDAGINNATLTVNTYSSKPRTLGIKVDTYFGITNVTYNYKVTHKEYLFGFAAITGVNNNSYGTATAAVTNGTVQAAIGVKSASTTATFTATPADGCQFLGWSTSQDGSTGYESTANPYKPTLNNTTAGSTTKKTLYAIFDNKQRLC